MYKYNYEFSKGKSKEIEVDEKNYNELKELDRIEYNSKQRANYRKVSLDVFEEDEEVYNSGINIDDIIIQKETNQKLYAAIEQLSPRQQKLIQEVFFEGKTLAEYAQECGINKSSATRRLQTILKKLKKLF